MKRSRLAAVALVVCAWGGCLTASAVAAAPKGASGPPTEAKGQTLAQAASKPHGVGARDHTGSGKSRKAVAPPKETGKTDGNGDPVSVQGCLLDYGGGDACLPTVSPAAAEMGMDEVSMPWTCTDVRLIHPQGIEVVGEDVLQLDTNKDGVACNAGDKA